MTQLAFLQSNVKTNFKNCQLLSLLTYVTANDFLWSFQFHKGYYVDEFSLLV